MSNRIHTPDGDENDLVVRLKKGQEEAYRTLVRQFQERLLRIAYGITQDREDSAEIVQDVFLQVYKRIHTFRGDAKLYTWLRRITVNQALNWQRRWKRRFKWHHQPIEKEEIYAKINDRAPSQDPETAYIVKELDARLKEELKGLPEDARTVFVLKELEGLSYGEISEVLHIKKGTVSSRLFYARQKLKKSMSVFLEQEESR